MEIFSGFNGKKIISGGTTSQIIARHLDKKIVPAVKNPHCYSKDEDGKTRVPPESFMEGADLAYEGIITLDAVSEMLQETDTYRRSEPAADKMVELFINSDRMLFLVGTRINEFYRDP
ncbi:MAG: hypothetical protein LBD44_04845 [Spirochaetaceae bacterium]|jgi:hypothetical protein|nr:hypothetical protein [Spirochaetaceae bacterium]